MGKMPTSLIFIFIYVIIVFLEKSMATHSSILAWRILWTEEPDVIYSPWSQKESDMTE